MRLTRHLTQEALAERSHLSYKFIGEIERGQGNPTVQTLGLLADALDVDIGELFTTIDRQDPADRAYEIRRVEVLAIRDALESAGEVLNRLAPPPRRPARKRPT